MRRQWYRDLSMPLLRCSPGDIEFVAEERVLNFECMGDRLFGILHIPERASMRGLLIVVGGPQYRVGSHRQFVLLARHLAKEGTPVLRFDYRGMGDSGGEPRTFEDIDADIRCAVSTFQDALVCVKEVVIWGLCDAASAALFYAPRDQRIKGLVLVNPWVHSEDSRAKSYLRHYYLQHLFSANLWRRVFRGEFGFTAAFRSFLANLAAAARAGKESDSRERGRGALGGRTGDESFRVRMAKGFRQFKPPVLVILSGADIVAAEFKDTLSGSRQWRGLMRRPNVVRRDLAEANHTFARREWREQVAVWTSDWIRSW